MKNVGKVLGILTVWTGAYMAERMFGVTLFYYWSAFVTVILALV